MEPEVAKHLSPGERGAHFLFGMRGREGEPSASEQEAKVRHEPTTIKKKG